MLRGMLRCDRDEKKAKQWFQWWWVRWEMVLILPILSGSVVPVVIKRTFLEVFKHDSFRSLLSDASDARDDTRCL